MTTITPTPHHVAVYGTLRPGERADHLWRGSATYVGGAWLEGWELRDGGSFPFAVRSVEPYAAIRVDVLHVDRETLAMFDRYEGYPRLYTRVRVPLQVAGAARPASPDGWVSAWIYTPDTAALALYAVDRLPRLPSGDWADRPTTV
jgi:gamma-glutamylcyclotransferase (GGCT)/AIG2-like uncharacterized protein YtfP